jgi:hypothetical protein
VRFHFHAGPESGVTNSKKSKKNARPSRGVILYHLDMRKNSNLDKSSLPENPFTKKNFHVWGCMTFRSNELGLALERGLVSRNEAISDTRVALGMVRNATEADFCCVPRKVRFPFSER